MSVKKNTTRPTPMLARLESTSQPRPCLIGLRIAMYNPTSPRESASAPKTMTSAKRLMFGHTRIATANAIARRPLKPSAQRAFLNRSSAACSAC
jgi:hypothetical protein